MFSSNTSQVSNDAVYIEDVFSTYLYTGNGSTQTITNGIDLAGKGGLVWTKKRQDVSGSTDLNHILFDTVRVSGANDFWLSTNNTNAQLGGSNYINYNSNGFDWTFGGSSWNGNTDTFASWTFRKQPKFFDIVTYTGNGTAGRTVAHNLGSVPGCIIVKKTDAVGNWDTYHRSIGETQAVQLNTTGAAFSAATNWNNTAPTSTVFTLGTDTGVNENGKTYVAYLFAHNAGGFGLTGTDNVISCGSFTTDASGVATINLGYEPQWLLVKRTNDISQWYIADNMRGMPVSGNAARLFANLTNAESASTFWFQPTSTGFGIPTGFLGPNTTNIYIAIRRGPMKVPTSGTSVFAPVLTTTNNTITTNFPVDLSIFRADRGTTSSNLVFDRLRGNTARLITSTTAAEATATAYPSFANNTGTDLTGFTSGLLGVDWAFRRAPGYFDEVCYSGTGTQNAKTHNLTVAPELIIVKKRTAVNGLDGWWVYQKDLPTNYVMQLNSTAAKQDTSGYTYPFFSSVGASTFTVGSTDQVNGTPETYVAYLFATCAGVSKVGSYTGNGSSQTINCGFTSGARFILIKRTDAASPWYVWDTARGIVAGNDPYLLLNSSVAEVQGYDDVDTASTGFIVNYYVGGATDINTSGGTYIYLAIA